MKTVNASLLAALLALAPGAFGADFYALAGVGVGPVDAAGFSETAVPATLGVGYRLGANFALEAGYTDLDVSRTHQRNDSSDGASGTIVATSSEWRGKGWGIFAAGAMPLSSRFSLVGRAGALRLEGETRASTTVTVLSTTPGVPATVTRTDNNVSETTWVPMLGIGIQERFERVTTRLMLQHAEGRSGSEFKRATALSLDLLYSF